MTVAVQTLSRVSVTVSDLGRLTRFYCDLLGFSFIDEEPLLASERRMLGLEVSAMRVRLLLGAQLLELLCPAREGVPYPANSHATDAWFQHIAIVVRDMDAAYAALRDREITPISTAGPERLPPSTGRVQAFKFRDPDGHPLELIEFPPGAGDPHWQQTTGNALFLGFDHSAVVVRDAARSLAFYEGLGLSAASRTLNQGPEQERLDGVPGACVDVIGLRPCAATTPHVELLAYQQPLVSPLVRPLRTADLASARLVFTVASLTDLGQDAVETDRRTGAMLRHDPDGHALIFEWPAQSSRRCRTPNRPRAAE